MKRQPIICEGINKCENVEGQPKEFTCQFLSFKYKKRIEDQLELTKEQVVLIGNHTFLNSINNIIMLLTYMDSFISEENDFTCYPKSLSILRRVHEMLLNNQEVLGEIDKSDLIYTICGEFVDMTKRTDIPKSAKGGVERMSKTLSGAVTALQERMQEYNSSLYTKREYEITSGGIQEDIFRFFESIHCPVTFIKEDAKSVNYFVDISVENLVVPYIFRTIIIDAVHNAKKYTPNGGEIDLKIWEDNGSIYIRVRDNGCGILKDDLQRIGEMGYRGNNANSASGYGYGVSKMSFFTRMYGGKSYVSSEKEKGTEFLIVLPIIDKGGSKRLEGTNGKEV